MHLLLALESATAFQHAVLGGCIFNRKRSMDLRVLVCQQLHEGGVRKQQSVSMLSMGNGLCYRIMMRVRLRLEEWDIEWPYDGCELFGDQLNTKKLILPVTCSLGTWLKEDKGEKEICHCSFLLICFRVLDLQLRYQSLGSSFFILAHTKYVLLGLLYCWPYLKVTTKRLLPPLTEDKVSALHCHLHCAAFYLCGLCS